MSQSQLLLRPLKPSTSLSYSQNVRRSNLTGISQRSRSEMIEGLRRKAKPQLGSIHQVGTRPPHQRRLRRAFEGFVGLPPEDYRLKLDYLKILNDVITMCQFSWSELESFVREVEPVALENLVETLTCCFASNWPGTPDFLETTITVLGTIVSVDTPEAQPNQPFPYNIADEFTKKLMQTSLPNLLMRMLGEVEIDLPLELANSICILTGDLCCLQSVNEWFVQQGQAIAVLCGYVNRNRDYPDTAIWVLRVLMRCPKDFAPEWIAPLARTLPSLYEDLCASASETVHSGIAEDLYILTACFHSHPSTRQYASFSVDHANKLYQTSLLLQPVARKAFARLCSNLTQFHDGVYVEALGNSSLMDYVEMRIQIPMSKGETVLWLQFLHNFLLGMLKEGRLQPNRLFPSTLVKDFLFVSLTEMKDDVWDEALFLWFAMLRSSVTMEEIHNLFDYDTDFNGIELLSRVLIYPRAELKDKAITAIYHILAVTRNTSYKNGRSSLPFALRFVDEPAITEYLTDAFHVIDNRYIEPILDTLEELRHLVDMGVLEPDGTDTGDSGYH